MSVGYKSVRVDGTSWYDGKFGPWEKGATLTVKGARRGEACGAGVHLGKTIKDAVQYGRFPFRLWKAEGVGDVLGEDDTKWRFGSVRVLSKVRLPAWAKDSEAFIATIADVPWFKPKDPPRKAWRHYETRAAAWDAAQAAARDAAQDAALLAQLHIVSDLDIPRKHWAHVRARWDVWTRGYGLLCDIQGVLYTYTKP